MVVALVRENYSSQKTGHVDYQTDAPGFGERRYTDAAIPSHKEGVLGAGQNPVSPVSWHVESERDYVKIRWQTPDMSL
jgi:hypothetical protein